MGEFLFTGDEIQTLVILIFVIVLSFALHSYPRIGKNYANQYAHLFYCSDLTLSHPVFRLHFQDTPRYIKAGIRKFAN